MSRDLIPALAQSSWVRFPDWLAGTSVGVPPQVSLSAIEAVVSSMISTSSGWGMPPEIEATALSVTVLPPKPNRPMNQGLTVVCSVTITALHPPAAVPAGASCVPAGQAAPVTQLVPALATERHSAFVVVVTLGRSL